jgi:hypothetical protein
MDLIERAYFEYLAATAAEEANLPTEMKDIYLDDQTKLDLAFYERMTQEIPGPIGKTVI